MLRCWSKKSVLNRYFKRISILVHLARAATYGDVSAYITESPNLKAILDKTEEGNYLAFYSTKKFPSHSKITITVGPLVQALFMLH